MKFPSAKFSGSMVLLVQVLRQTAVARLTVPECKANNFISCESTVSSVEVSVVHGDTDQYSLALGNHRLQAEP
jgi:hypothetical protein